LRTYKINMSKVKTLVAVVNRSKTLAEPGTNGYDVQVDAMNSSPQSVCSGLWRWLQGTGLERFELVRAADDWVFRGTILTLAGDAAAEATYEIVCDRSFRTRSASISLLDSSGERRLKVETQNGRWYENGIENQTVAGAIDIDLGWSPSTNTLPIRRLGLEIGQTSGEFIAAWVRFPDLALQPLQQEYVRLSDRQYRYSSCGGAFIANVLVDGDGLVEDYEGFWQRAEKS